MVTGKRRVLLSIFDDRDLFLKAKNVKHVIVSRLFVQTPKCCFQCALGIKAPVRGDMSKDDAFTSTGENDIMFTDNITTPDCRESNVPAIARTGDPVAPTILNIRKTHVSPRSRSLTQHQGRAGWRINFLIVVSFDNLNVKIVTQSMRSLLNKFGQ